MIIQIINFGFDFYTTHVASKNPQDTYNIYAKERGESDTTIKWRSKSYTILDFIGYVQPIKNLTIRAGVYNLTNRKYITWESARSIRSFGTSNVIEQSTGLGINRSTHQVETIECQFNLNSNHI